MLKKCTKAEFEQYIDFICGLALAPSKSGYPTYTDGIRTKEMLAERSKEAFARETEDIPLFVHDGKVEGRIHSYWIPENHYLSTTGFNINVAADYLSVHGFACIEADYSHTDFLDKLTPAPMGDGSVPVTRANYPCFRKIHLRGREPGSRQGVRIPLRGEVCVLSNAA